MDMDMDMRTSMCDVVFALMSKGYYVVPIYYYFSIFIILYE